MPSLLHVFLVYVLHPESDTTVGENVQKAAKQYLVEQKAGSMAHRQRVWKVSRKLCPVQVFPKRIAMFLGEYHMDRKIIEKAMHLSCTQWSGE